MYVYKEGDKPITDGPEIAAYFAKILKEDIRSDYREGNIEKEEYQKFAKIFYDSDFDMYKFVINYIQQMEDPAYRKFLHKSIDKSYHTKIFGFMSKDEKARFNMEFREALQKRFERSFW